MVILFMQGGCSLLSTLRKMSQGPRIEELLEAALVSPAGCVLTSGRGRCAVCRAGFLGEVVFVL